MAQRRRAGSLPDTPGRIKSTSAHQLTRGSVSADIQPPIDLQIHRTKAGTPADHIRDRFRQKDTIYAKSDPGQHDRQRRDDDHLAQHRKEDRLPGPSESQKRSLPAELESHKAESEEIELERTLTDIQHLRVIRKYGQPKT